MMETTGVDRAVHPPIGSGSVGGALKASRINPATDQIRIQRVGNGYILEPFVMPGYAVDSASVHVFPDIPSIAAWMEEHFKMEGPA